MAYGLDYGLDLDVMNELEFEQQSARYAISWRDIEIAETDREMVVDAMAAAYDAGAYSVMRYWQAGVPAPDLPIGAALIERGTKQIYQGYAQDKELGDKSAHAEVMALRNALAHASDTERTIDFSDTVLAVTLEPCPRCLDELHAHGIAVVAYGASRESVENLGLIKRHAKKAPELLAEKEALAATGMELFQIPDKRVQAASLELFAGLERDPITEVVKFDPKQMHATRYNNFARDMDEIPRIWTPNGEEIKIRSEREAFGIIFPRILDEFLRLPR